MTPPNTSRIQDCLNGLRPDDPAARQAVLAISQERLRLLVRRMLRRYPGVRRWEETDDVLQNVLIRLDRMLKGVRVDAVADYLRLAATHIRRELIDLARHYSGPRGLGANHATPAHGGAGPPDTVAEPSADSSGDPARLALWTEFHRQIGLLPEEEREVFDLHWYHGLTQAEAAALLGISLATVKRRWLSSRRKLTEVFGEDLFDLK
jgi:RNA polymerase sigma-70 factor (ECF subfamily)